MTAPRTAAGARLMVTMRSMWSDTEWLAAAEFDISAVEVEARRAALSEARAAVEALPNECHDSEGLGCEWDYATGKKLCHSLQLAAVLAALDALAAEP